ncbi:DNA repair protein complementing XP-A cells homolog [Tribolium madens]|uniref:DNA repair protein complementing XP-A cells homolog n=1 Tax=Tribolium madens TaxID=41895 RepID=UPI001CF7609A|nr:DNA repair protein complementing XP-A cells homolog [Tribolium madens]
MSESDETLSELSQSRIERNRQKALAIRQAKLVSHPNAKSTAISIDKTTIKIGSTRYKDTGGGFLLEEELEKEKLESEASAEPPVLEEDRPNCIKCKKPIATSWLFDNFHYKCCDSCKDLEEHKLITKTEALKTYLLKDIDLDKREPPLKYITKKNPHHVRWGDMKLYLQLQVEERALEIWGSKEAMEEERLRREDKRVILKAKRYQKELKELRMSMRSSLYDRTSAAAHVHEFGPETYNEEEDTYSRNCLTCSYVETFEKM